MTEDLGTPTRPHALTGEQWRLEVRTDDPPSPSADERWIRSDLDSGDRIATLKCGDGTEIPLFATGSAEETVREARRYRVGGQTVYAPLAPVDEAAFPARRVQHDGQTHAFHDRVAPGSAIPDSGLLHRWNVRSTSYPITDSVGSNDFEQGAGGTFVTDSRYYDDVAYQTDGSDDYADGVRVETDTFTVCWFVEPASTGVTNRTFQNGDNGEEWPLILQDSGDWVAELTGTFIRGGTPTDTSLQQVAARYDGSVFSLVVDATEVASTSKSDTQPTSGDSVLRLGAGQKGSGVPEGFWGGVSDLGLFYDRYLSDSELQDIYDEHPST